MLAFERGVSTLGQQMGFRNELDAIIAAAKENGAANDPLIRQKDRQGRNRLAPDALWRACRMLSSGGAAQGAALTYKIQWAKLAAQPWRTRHGRARDKRAKITDSEDYEWDFLPNLFLYSRADTIYGGTNQIQRNIIAERALGMPREPRGDR